MKLSFFRNNQDRLNELDEMSSAPRMRIGCLTEYVSCLELVLLLRIRTACPSLVVVSLITRTRIEYLLNLVISIPSNI